MTVESLDWQSLSPADALGVGEVLFSTWPPKDQPNARPQPARNFSGYTGPANRRPRLFVTRENGRIVSHASIFAREIAIGSRRYWAAALGGVCTYPHLRKHGYARTAVLAAFALVDRGDFDLSLFQSPVPAFYEKLGCRCIPNRIVNSAGADPAACPFWDPYVMVYPKALALPPDPIDLRGPGY